MSDFRPLRRLHLVGVFFFALFLLPSILSAQVTTGAMSGVVTSTEGEPLVGATIIAIHEPTQTQYGAVVREGGNFNISNMRIGGPYTVRVQILGYEDGQQADVYVSLNQTVATDFALIAEAIEVAGIQVIAEEDPVLNSHRTGAATYVTSDQVVELPSIRRSTRDLSRLDPRSDGNFSFGGKNWLYNNISLDGSYFNNPFGLDDPAPGGQTASEPVPFDAIEAVQVSIAPFDIRQSGFTGAAINSVTKSGTNKFKGTAYTFTRNESFIGDKVSGSDVLNPDLSFNQSGFSLGGPLAKDQAFFFVNYERIRRDDPGSNFVAARPGSSGPFVSRVQASDLEAISERLFDSYGYVTGPFEGYIHETNSDKFLGKLDWNVNDNNHFIFRYTGLRADRALPPHPFAISINNTGRGPNENSLPFQNSGYAINNKLDSYVWELNTQAEGYANRLFASYNRFRRRRSPASGTGRC
ncbi:MAG: carboxypeptidase regulatory-like domain-containing protein [Gemmatimonadota bacterium]